MSVLPGSPHEPGSWYAAGAIPESGSRYEFEDFVGARFTATFERHESVIEDGQRTLVLHFSDRCSFGTTLPIRFREAVSA